MVTVSFHSNAPGRAPELILTLTVAYGQPVRAQGDSSWLDFSFQPFSAALGRPVSFEQDAEEWARSLAACYPPDGQVTASLSETAPLPAPAPVSAPAPAPAPFAPAASFAPAVQFAPTQSQEPVFHSGRRLGRWQTGWLLTKASWSLLRAKPSLMALPLISALMTVLVFVLIAAPAVLGALHAHSKLPLIIAGVGLSVASTFIATYFNVALIWCTSQMMAGQRTSVGEGLRAATGKLGLIAGWSLFAATVGLLISQLQRFGVLGRIAELILDVAWAISTYLAVPVLIFEGVSPLQIPKRSVAMIRSHFGVTAAAVVSTAGTVILLLLVPVIALAFVVAALLAALGVSGAVAGGGLVVVLIGAFVFAGIVASSIEQMTRAAVYSYIKTGQAPGRYPSVAMEGLIRPKRGKLGRLAGR